MKNSFGKLVEKLSSSFSKMKPSDVDFGGKMEKLSDNAFVFESYGQKTEIKKNDDGLFSIGEIVESEKNIKLIADFINRGKMLAVEGYRDSIENNVVGISFDYYPDFLDYNVSVVFHVENDVDPEERGDEYEAGYGKSVSIIDKKSFQKMNKKEKEVIQNNLLVITKYLNDRAKEVRINS